jgi:hypothetical protein
MRSASKIALMLVLAVTACVAQTQTPAQRDQAKIVRRSEDAAVAALKFRMGDLQSFTRAQRDFTPDGWKDYVKHMDGYLDAKGAPTFTSSFTPSGPPTVLDEKNGVVHFRFPGSLVQQDKIGRTTYRAAIEVYALRDRTMNDGESVKIQRLEQITCVGDSKACE